MNRLNIRTKGEDSVRGDGWGESFFEMILYACTLYDVTPPLWLGGNKLTLSLKGMVSLKQ